VDEMTSFIFKINIFHIFPLHFNNYLRSCLERDKIRHFYDVTGGPPTKQNYKLFFSKSFLWRHPKKRNSIILKIIIKCFMKKEKQNGIGFSSSPHFFGANSRHHKNKLAHSTFRQFKHRHSYRFSENDQSDELVNTRQ
jgi:hypothetical protein